MTGQFEGRSALITGASQGIGKACAASLAAAGTDVAIVARDQEKIDAAVAELSSNSGGRVIGISADLSTADGVNAAVEQARAELGKIDILINNAGAAPAGRLEDLDDETWQASFDLKFMGYARCARAVAGEMRERKWGRIVNVIGLGGHNPAGSYILGGSFNAALRNFTRALAKDLARDNVLVNGINPGPTDTPRWQTLVEQKSSFTGRSADDLNSEAMAEIPLNKLGTPEDIAALATFLCSDAAGHMSGALIDVDGAGSGGI